MEYISTDESEKFDIKHGILTESPVRGSTARYVTNHIVDDINAVDPDGPADPIHPKIEYVSPSCLFSGNPSVNNLATHRWHNGGLDAETEAQLIQRIKDGDGRAFRQLLEAFHRSIVSPAGKHVPRGAHSRRQPKGQKHTNDLLYEDLTSAGCFALWQSALKFEPDSGYRFSTLSRHKIAGAISNEATYLRRPHGVTSGDGTVGRYLRATRLAALGKELPRRTESRADRWIFSHLGSPPEELLEWQKKNLKRPVFHSLQEAADAIRRANNLQHPDIHSDGDDDADRDDYSTAKTNTATEPLEEFRDVYQSQDPLYWSLQLAPHRNTVSPIVDFWTRELCDPLRIKAKPQPKPVYKPCKVKPTGRVLRPIDKPYWMLPRDKAPDILERKPPYDRDRREIATVRLKNGKTKRQYRQIAASEQRKPSVREPNQANGSAAPNIAVFKSRAGRKPRLHVSQRHLPSSIGKRFTCSRIAG
jgi:DNA-directed RNA polymerase specialized sigma subunit